MGIKPVVTATGQVIAATIMLIPVVAFVDRPWTLVMPGISTWLAVIGLAVLSTSISYIL